MVRDTVDSGAAIWTASLVEESTTIGKFPPRVYRPSSPNKIVGGRISRMIMSLADHLDKRRYSSGVRVSLDEGKVVLVAKRHYRLNDVPSVMESTISIANLSGKPLTADDAEYVRFVIDAVLRLTEVLSPRTIL